MTGGLINASYFNDSSSSTYAVNNGSTHAYVYVNFTAFNSSNNIFNYQSSYYHILVGNDSSTLDCNISFDDSQCILGTKFSYRWDVQPTRIVLQCYNGTNYVYPSVSMCSMIGYNRVYFQDIVYNVNILSYFNPTQVYANNTLFGFCSASSFYSNNLTFFYNSYLNGVLNSSNNVTLNSSLSSCYQESANVSNQTGLDGSCGLNYSGSYPSNLINNNWNDGDWATYSNSGNNASVVYIKPTYAVSSSKWNIKDGDGVRYLSIPSDCWNYSPYNLTFVVDIVPSYVYWYCYNGSANHLLSASSSSGKWSYDEAMNWTVLQNTSIVVNVVNISSLSKFQNWSLGCSLNDGTQGYTITGASSVLSPSESKSGNFVATNLSDSYDELVNAWFNPSMNVTTTISNVLWVPYFSSSTSCGVSDLQNGSACNIGSVNMSLNCMVTDEFSQVGIGLSMGVNATRMDQFYNTLLVINGSFGQLPSWKIIRNGTQIIPVDARTNSNGNTASDADARVIIALYNAGNNSNFNLANRTKYIALANNLSRDFLLYDVVKESHVSNVISGNISYWLSDGAVQSISGLGSNDFIHTGYFPDAIIAMIQACNHINSTYCAVAQNITLEYLQASRFNGVNFTVSTGNAFKWSNLTGVPVANCTNTCSPDMWDYYDSPRIFGLGMVEYYMNISNMSNSNLSSYMNLWRNRYMQTYSSVPIQYYSNGTNSSSWQSGFWAQGLQSQGLVGNVSGGGLTLFNSTLRSFLGHYDSTPKTMDYSSCFGVYQEAIGVRALGMSIGRDLNSYVSSFSSPIFTSMINSSIVTILDSPHIISGFGLINYDFGTVTPFIVNVSDVDNDVSWVNFSITFPNGSTRMFNSTLNSGLYISSNVTLVNGTYYVSIVTDNVSVDVSNYSRTCYQQFANVTTSCGGLSTGKYVKAPYYWYINWSIPFQSSPIWMVKHSILSAYNVSIPSDGVSSIFQSRMYSVNNVSEQSFGQYFSYVSSSWLNVTQVVDSPSGGTCTVTDSNEFIDGDWNSFEQYQPFNNWTNMICGLGYGQYSAIYDSAVYWNFSNSLSFSVTNGIQVVSPSSFTSVISSGQNYSFIVSIDSNTSNLVNYSISCLVSSNMTCVVPSSILVNLTSNFTVNINTSTLSNGQYVGNLTLTRILDGYVSVINLSLGISNTYGVPLILNISSPYVLSMLNNQVSSISFNLSNNGTYDLSGCVALLDSPFNQVQTPYALSMSGSIAPNQSQIVSLTFSYPSIVTWSGYMYISCNSTGLGTLNGLANSPTPLIYLSVSQYIPSSTGGGGGGSTSPIQVTSNASTFSLIYEKGGNGMVDIASQGQSKVYGYYVTSKVTSQLTLAVSCAGDGCQYVTIPQPSLTVFGGMREGFSVNFATPSDAKYGSEYNFDIVVSNGLESYVVKNSVSVSKTSDYLTKITTLSVPNTSSPAYLGFAIGSFLVPKLLFYFIMLFILAGLIYLFSKNLLTGFGVSFIIVLILTFII